MTSEVAEALDALTERIGRLEKAAKAPERVAWRPREVAQKTGIEYTRVLELIKSGRLRAIRDGRLHIIPDAELRRFLDEESAT